MAADMNELNRILVPGEILQPFLGRGFDEFHPASQTPIDQQSPDRLTLGWEREVHLVVRREVEQQEAISPSWHRRARRCRSNVGIRRGAAAPAAAYEVSRLRQKGVFDQRGPRRFLHQCGLALPRVPLSISGDAKVDKAERCSPSIHVHRLSGRRR